MESKNEVKELDIKNCTCYCFVDIIKAIDINFNDILFDKNYGISYKTSMCTKPLRIMKHIDL